MAMRYAIAKYKEGETHHTLLFSNNNFPIGCPPFPTNPPFTAPLSNTFVPRTHVSLTTPRSSRPWYGDTLFRKRSCSRPTTNGAVSSKTQMSASRPGRRAPFWWPSPTCCAVLTAQRRTMSTMLREGERDWAVVQRMGSPRPTEDMPPQEEKKSPRSRASACSWLRMVPLTVFTGPEPHPWLRCEGRSFSSGVQGLWSETTVWITELGWVSSAQRPSRFEEERMGGQHLCRVSPSATSSAARAR